MREAAGNPGWGADTQLFFFRRFGMNAKEKKRWRSDQLLPGVVGLVVMMWDGWMEMRLIEPPLQIDL